MIVLDSKGREMVHPDEVKDMVNDSVNGYFQYLNYKKDYEEALNKVGK